MPPADPLKINIDPVFTGAKPAEKTTPTGIYNVLNNQEYSPAIPHTPTPEKPMDKKKERVSLVRTYKGDMESAIAANHLSSVNIAIAENQKLNKQIRSEKKETPNTTSDYSKNKIIIFISIILILAGVIVISFVYITNNKTNQIISLPELPSLITTEYKDELNISALNKNTAVITLASKLNDIQIPVNNFYNTYITTGTSTNRRLINSIEFISLTSLKIPDQMKRTLLPDFMVGMFSFGKNLPFIIFKTSYFENTYAGMLEWEGDLEKDLQILFRLSGFENAGGILADLNPTTSRKFSDAVIINKDVRLLRNEDGQITLLYGIIDKETVVITVNDTAFKEVIDRLNKEKGLRR